MWTDQRLGSEDVYYKRGENETGILEAKSLEAERSFRISVSPNPFSKKVRIGFALPQDAGGLKLEIFDITGRMVKDLVPVGPEGFTYWDGTDTVGDRLPAGVYFIRLSSHDEEQVTPIVLLR